MSFWRPTRRALALWLPAALLVLVPLAASAATPQDAPGDGHSGERDYVVMLSVRDAGRSIRPSGQTARHRIRLRASRTTAETDRLARTYGLKTGHRYTSAISGFSATMTPRQAARLRSDPGVSSVQRALRYEVAAQVVPRSLRRVNGAPVGAPGPDTDVDIAVLDTGIGPVGGNELNIRGGINCSGDGLGENAWDDRYVGRHGTHVAGTAAARDNGRGAVGVAAGARLWSVRVFRASGFGDQATIACGLDWAVSTHGPDAPPGSQPIEVINMSLQGPRPSPSHESCDGGTDPDPIHEAICAAYAAGITVVVAAGNDSTNAANVSPAGYDQVITVGAISDFDGRGDGEAEPDCPFFDSEKDDGYASYSNFGQDVDILAPGTCVTSTYPSASGDETRRLSGTSMASPHVAGAVARYLSEHPGTSPAQMAKLVRASGGLDWRLKSDPRWFGPNDPDSPNRILDVKALMGPPGLHTWIYPKSYRVGATVMTRRVRIDVQRSGGYDGDVKLGLTGLPASMASADFDRPGATLVGLSGLGARLTITFEASGTDGVVSPAVEAKGPGGSPSAAANLHLLVDRTGPTVVMASPRFETATIARSGAASVVLRWRANDALSSVRKTGLQRRAGGQPWRSVAIKAGKSFASITVKPGRAYRFRAQATDTLGNTASSVPLALRLQVVDSNSPRWLGPASAWSRASTKAALGGSVLLSRTMGQTLSATFDGTAVAIVAPVGPKRGAMRVRVDGRRWHAVSLTARRGANRRVVFSRRYPAGTHSMEIQTKRGQAAIDALLVIG